MSDEIPGEQPDSHSRRRAAVILLAVALVAALVVVAIIWTTDRPAKKPAAAPRPPVVTTPLAGTTPAAPKPRKKVVRHDPVTAAAPTEFAFSGKGYTVRANVCGMEYIRPLDPPGDQHHTVCWVQHDFGHAPGTNGSGTTYILGHAWAQDAQEVLNPIAEPAMRQVLSAKARGTSKIRDGITTYRVTALDGDVISLRTANGVLRYSVRDAYGVAKEDAGSITSLMAENTAHRVVIITCGELNHVDYDYNIIVEAYLSSSRATARSRA
jgi:hypothetical protein